MADDLRRFGSSRDAPRSEDDPLLAGRGRFTDDLKSASHARAVFVRSPMGHAALRGVDIAAAAKMPGVLAVITGAELAREGLGSIPPGVLLPGRDGKPMFATAMPALAHERVRYVGEPVALVVAQSLPQALDAADAVQVDYEELPAVSHVERALAPGAPILYPAAPGNLALDWEHGDAAAVDAAFKSAAHKVAVRLEDTRVAPSALEPRAATAAFDAKSGRYTLTASTQGVALVRKVLAESVFKVPPQSIRVLTHDVGGGFGMKVQVYAEYAALLAAAKRCGRPVHWCATRLESFLADTHGRDGVLAGELALDASGKFLALRARSQVGIGAYASTYAAIVATNNTKNCLSSVYRIPAIHAGVKMVLTNAAPLGPYRGAGRPEAIYLVERLIDEAARMTRIDRVELRRRNLIPASSMPYKAPSGQTYDSGEFGAVLDKAL
ncbi:MAG: molybdopterin-dependent oxidoreductase, partial [Betaproteobacteria bacterium]|nr:molybdopterin-dependent oxidoreductase [Betaproteobacteria bacterium]